MDDKVCRGCGKTFRNYCANCPFCGRPNPKQNDSPAAVARRQHAGALEKKWAEIDRKEAEREAKLGKFGTASPQIWRGGSSSTGIDSPSFASRSQNRNSRAPSRAD